MILFLVGASGVHIGCCLNPLEVCVWWLDCLLLKEGASAFCTLGDCLKCFLLLRSLWVFAQAVGFHLNDCIEYFTTPCWPPLAPLDSYRIFQPRKNMNCDFFQSIPLLINSINLKRDGVRICLGKDVER